MVKAHLIFTNNYPARGIFFTRGASLARGAFFREAYYYYPVLGLKPASLEELIIVIMTTSRSRSSCGIKLLHPGLREYNTDLALARGVCSLRGGSREPFLRESA